MRFSFLLMVVTSLLLSCETSNRSESSDTTSMSKSDTVATQVLSKEKEGHCNFQFDPQDSLLVFPVIANQPLLLLKQADSSASELKEVPFHARCLVYRTDVMEMKPYVRCMLDSCIGYVPRKLLFQTFPSPTNDEEYYLVWRSSPDTSEICRVNARSKLIQDQLSLPGSGVYVYATLHNSQAWAETGIALQLEMNPAACESTRYVHVIDDQGKLKVLTSTSSYAEEGSSWDSYLVFKNDQILHVVETSSESTEDGKERSKTEVTEYRWNGDSLEFIGKNLLSGN